MVELRMHMKWKMMVEWCGTSGRENITVEWWCLEKKMVWWAPLSFHLLGFIARNNN
jgi:hypothetical protein